MPITAAFSVMAVADLEQATDFYTRLFGRPADAEPMPSLAQWNLHPAGGGVQVIHDPEHSGASMCTLLVNNLGFLLEELNGRSITTGEIIDGAISRLTQINDPAGNTITLTERHR